MLLLRIILAVTIGGASYAAVTAKTVSADYSNFTQSMNSVVGGDTVVMTGQFYVMTTRDLSFSSPVFIDATAAVFHRTWTIRNVDNLSVTGGKFLFQPEDPSYLKAIQVFSGNNISFDRGTYKDRGKLGAISFTDTLGVNISNSTFTNMKNSIVLSRVTGGTIYNNKTVGTTVDAIDIAASHDIVVNHNSCINAIPTLNAHPDCIQIFSVAGLPISSNIEISDNLAFGDTQGFTKFAFGGPATNISIVRNLVETTFPQGIACYDCHDSTISDNLLVTLAAADHKVSVNVVGGANNVVSNNVLDISQPEFPYRPAAGTIWHNAGVIPWNVTTSVPEPATWLSLTLGFAAMGGTMRRKRVALA